MIVHIGYHKTASSWLQRHVFGNPETGLQTVGKFGPDHPVRQFVRARPLEFDAAATRALFEPLLQPVHDSWSSRTACTRSSPRRRSWP